MSSTTANETRRLARTAGLKDLKLPSLEQVDRRRAQLWALSLLVAIVVPVGMIAANFNLVSPDVVENFEDRAVRLALLAMLVAVLGYVAEREVTLRRLTGMLVEERVLTASLVSRIDEVNLLLRATRAMNSALDLSAVLNQIADSAHNLLRASAVSIQLVDTDNPNNLIVVTAIGDSGAVVGGVQAIGEGLACGAISRGDALLVDSSEAPGRGRQQTGDVLVVPMEIRGILVGVISVDTGPGRDPFTEFDLRGLSVFADAAAASITNARSFEQQLGEVAQLLEQDRAKDEFLMLVTHELRTPLTSMIGLMTTMASRADQMGPGKIAEYAEIAKNQGWRLDRLIEDLLTSSRQMAGAITITPDPVDMGDAVTSAITGLRRALPSHPISLSVPDGLRRAVDMDALNRIIDNLLSNAAKYTAPGTQVDVVVEGTEPGIRLQVRDHGQGIPDDVFNSLFEKFNRGPDPFDRGGLGLGLFVVKALAEAHGGHVEVGHTLGGGATFEVHLAAAPA